MSAPHKLPDGSWSDGVIRDWPIRSLEFFFASRDRMHVVKEYRGWRIWKQGLYFPPFKTHAEAIAYADRKARE